MRSNSHVIRNFIGTHKMKDEILEKKHVAVVDDESDIVELVSLHLRRAGFEVTGFPDGKHFFNFIRNQTPDLVILDLMLPDSNGLEICKYLKREEKFHSIPIIMLTARGDESDKIIGLELGADDYVTKPFSPKELVARVKAVLRRHSPKDEGGCIEVGRILRIDSQRHKVIVSDHPVDLTSTEFKILYLLASKKGWVFTRDQILNFLWGQDKFVLDRTIDVHIKHLRDKLGRAAVFIKNIRGVGYKIEE